MSFTRIQFASDATGSGLYLLPINPVSIEAEDSKNISMVNCLGSEPVAFEAAHDDRPIVFVWKTMDAVTYSGMISTLDGYVLSEKYVKLNDVQPLFVRLFTSTGYNGPYIVYNFEKKIRDGGGKIFEELRLTLIKKGS